MAETEAQKKRRLILEDRKTRLDVVIRAAQSALKTAFLVNGGGAIAILGFFGQTVQSGSSNPAAPALACSLFVFAIGTGLAGLATGLSFLAQYAYFIRGSAPRLGRRALLLTKLNICLVLGSLGCFVFASYLAYKGFRQISCTNGPVQASLNRVR